MTPGGPDTIRTRTAAGFGFRTAGTTGLGRPDRGVLLSHPVTRAVPSAQKGLASGFGMGPGVSPSLLPPKLYGISIVPDRIREPHDERESTKL